MVELARAGRPRREPMREPYAGSPRDIAELREALHTRCGQRERCLVHVATGGGTLSACARKVRQRSCAGHGCRRHQPRLRCGTAPHSAKRADLRNSVMEAMMQTDATSTHDLIASDRVEGTPVRGTD